MPIDTDLLMPLTNVKLLEFLAVGTNTKIVPVPSDERWIVQTILVLYKSSAVVGNRQLFVQFHTDGGADAILMLQPSSVLQAENLSLKYTYGFGLDRATAGGHRIMPIPPVVLLPGYEVRIFDAPNIDAAGDDMDIRMMVGFGPTL